MNDSQRMIANTRARIAAVLALRAAAPLISAWLLAWGIVVLALRGTLFVSREPLLWGLAGVVVAVIAGVAIGVRRCPSVEAVRALLDAHWRLGGLLMTAGETGSADWPVNIPAASGLSVRWRGERQCGILLCCAIFVVASFLVPARFLGESDSRRLLIGAEVEKLAEKVDLLKEEQILPPERAKSLEQTLEQLQHDALGSDPAKTWEAMDHLEQAVAKTSAEAAQETAKNAEKAARAEELAAALDKSKDQLAAPELAEALRVLARDVQRAAAENNLIADLLDETKDHSGEGSLSPDQLSKLAQALGKCKECDLAKLRKLAAGRLIDAALLERIKGECEIDPDALANLLCKCNGSVALGRCLASCNKPGRGGVTRGRGDAAMTWTDPAHRDDVEFKEKVLPPGAIASLQHSRLQGISLGDPTPTEPGASSAGGALDSSIPGRGSARTQVILPEHKKVIQRYFAREPAARAKTSTNP